MKRLFQFWLSLGLLAAHSAASDGVAPTSIHEVGALLGTYCLDCHTGGDPAGGLDLESVELSLPAEPSAWDTSVWEKVVKRLRTRQMPPAEATRPDEAEYTSALARLESALDTHAKRFPFPGRTAALRRLTRTEYRNAIRDLLNLEVDLDEVLPADHFAHGFDNVNVEDLSPALVERYLTAAEQISKLATGTFQQPVGRTIRLPPDRTQDKHVEGLPLGTRGGAIIAHNFPQSGEYEIRLRLARDRDEHVEGLHRTHKIDVLLDGKLAHQFTVEPAKSKTYLKRDETNLDAHLGTRVHAEAGPHRVGVTFPVLGSSLAETKRQPFDASFNRHRHPRRNPAIFEISITGPLNANSGGDTPSRIELLESSAQSFEDGTERATALVRQLAKQAYRRPVDANDVAPLMAFFYDCYEEDGFDIGVQRALAAILVNPNFLLRIEQNPPHATKGEVVPVTDVELASRLSFFLWSSIPDEELLDLAEAGQLREPDELARQVARMLRDPRSESLVTNFAAQWLYLRNLDSFRPDMRLFPDFDDNLRQALRKETELLFESVVKNDRSVIDLITSRETYLNERLASHYGIPHVYGSHFRPVEVSADSKRGGLLRHGSILAVTSYATRTSPTIRGNWVLENIFGTPAPPPPPNVPSLNNKSTLATLTLRERLAEHRENPACASCHNLMDPVGLAMENFDAVGRWRDLEQGKSVDASGQLPDGSPLTGVDGIEANVVDRPEAFVGTLVEKLMTFGLGRGIEPADGPAVREILRKSADSNYRFSSLVLGIVESPPFRLRTVR